MWQFKDYMIESWLENGLMVRAKSDDLMQTVRSVVRNMAAGAAIAGAAFAVSDAIKTEAPQVGAVWTHFAVEQFELDLDGIIARFRDSEKLIDEKIARLSNPDVDDIDSEFLALAEAALSRIKG